MLEINISAFVSNVVHHLPRPIVSKNTICFIEWTHYLDNLAIIPEKLVITGDLNFYIDNPNDSEEISLY